VSWAGGPCHARARICLCRRLHELHGSRAHTNPGAPSRHSKHSPKVSTNSSLLRHRTGTTGLSGSRSRDGRPPSSPPEPGNGAGSSDIDMHGAYIETWLNLRSHSLPLRTLLTADASSSTVYLAISRNNLTWNSTRIPIVGCFGCLQGYASCDSCVMFKDLGCQEVHKCVGRPLCHVPWHAHARACLMNCRGGRNPNDPMKRVWFVRSACVSLRLARTLVG